MLFTEFKHYSKKDMDNFREVLKNSNIGHSFHESKADWNRPYVGYDSKTLMITTKDAYYEIRFDKEISEIYNMLELLSSAVKVHG